MSYSISNVTGGGRVLSSIVGGCLFKRTYLSGSESDMLKKFKEDIKKSRGIS